MKKLELYKDPLSVLRVKMTNKAKADASYVMFTEDTANCCTKLSQFLDETMAELCAFHASDSLEVYKYNFHSRVKWILNYKLQISNSKLQNPNSKI